MSHNPSSSSMVAGPVITLSLLLESFLFLANHISVVESEANTTIESIQCSTSTWGGGKDDPYGATVSKALDDLVNSAPFMQYYTDYVVETNQGTTVYGYAACDEDLVQGECFECLDRATVELGNSCPSAIGAQIVMADCYVRYENYPFPHIG